MTFCESLSERPMPSRLLSWATYLPQYSGRLGPGKSGSRCRAIWRSTTLARPSTSMIGVIMMIALSRIVFMNSSSLTASR